MLVPLDIQHKTFKTAVSGYNKQEVQEFLLQLEKDFAQLYRDNKELQEKVEKLGDEVNRYRSTGRQLEQALTLAQSTAEDVKKSARQEADLILSNAKSSADLQLRESREMLRGLMNGYLEFKSEFRAYLTTFLNLLDNMDSSLSAKIKEAPIKTENPSIETHELEATEETTIEEE